MYQKYQTEALVLRSRANGEGDMTLALYTRDFGLLRAKAKGIRNEKSKMRYSLQNFSRAHVALIRGSGGWRLAGAHALAGAEASSSQEIGVFARAAELLLRLVAGEEPNPYLFDVLAEVHRTLFTKTEVVSISLATIELLCVARILYALGYISTEAFQTALFTHSAFTDAHLREAQQIQQKLLSSVNNAIAETHL